MKKETFEFLLVGETLNSGESNSLSEDQINRVKRFDAVKVFPDLYAFLLKSEGIIKVRLFEAILHLENFDAIGFLVQHGLCFPTEQDTIMDGIATVISSRYDLENVDSRLISYLMHILEWNPDPYNRNLSIGKLQYLGNRDCIPKLKELAENDHEVDDEGYKVSFVSRNAIDMIEERISRRGS